MARSMRSEGLTAHLNRVTAGEKPGTLDERTASASDLVTAHLKYAVSIATRYSRTPEELEDNVGKAHVGLLLAVDTFDPGRGPFLAWARLYMTSQIRDGRENGLGGKIRQSEGRSAVRVVSSANVVLRGAGGDSDLVELGDGAYAVDAHESTPFNDAPIERAMLSRSIGKLAGRRRDALVCTLAGLSVREIAEKWGTSHQNARACVDRGVQDLQKLAGGNDGR